MFVFCGPGSHLILIADPPSAVTSQGVPSPCARCVSPELGSSSASDRSSSILILLLKMTALRCIGSCLSLFVMAIVFDILGVVLLFVGIFGNVRMRGVFYGDFLIHTGALVLFVSLALWLMWYVGNIRVKDEGLARRSSAALSIKALARKLTERLSKTPLKDNTGEKRFIVGGG